MKLRGHQSPHLNRVGNDKDDGDGGVAADSAQNAAQATQPNDRLTGLTDPTNREIYPKSLAWEPADSCQLQKQYQLLDTFLLSALLGRSRGWEHAAYKAGKRVSLSSALPFPSSVSRRASSSHAGPRELCARGRSLDIIVAASTAWAYGGEPDPPRGRRAHGKPGRPRRLQRPCRTRAALAQGASSKGHSGCVSDGHPREPVRLAPLPKAPPHTPTESPASHHTSSGLTAQNTTSWHVDAIMANLGFHCAAHRHPPRRDGPQEDVRRPASKKKGAW